MHIKATTVLLYSRHFPIRYSFRILTPIQLSTGIYVPPKEAKENFVLYHTRRPAIPARTYIARIRNVIWLSRYKARASFLYLYLLIKEVPHFFRPF
jgi:hypothetical protein